MDRDKIKKLVIKKKWKGEKDSDEYRSLSKQIDNRLKAIEKDNPFFSSYPMDILTDEKLANLIANLVGWDNTENRKILSQSSKSNGLRHQYADIQYIDEKKEKTNEVMNEAFFESLEEKEIAPGQLFGDGSLMTFTLLVCNNIIRSADPETYKTSLLAIQYMIHDLIDELTLRKHIHKLIGIEYIDNDNLEEFIFLADSVFRGIYLYIILGEKKNFKSNFSLDILLENLTKLETIFKKESKKVLAEYKQIQETLSNEDIASQLNLGAEESEALKQIQADFNIEDVTSQFDLDVLTSKHRSYLGFKDYIDECNKITDRLLNEITNEPALFTEQGSVNERTDLERDLCSGKHIPNFEKKMNTVEQLVTYAAKHNNQYFDDLNPATKKILFQELWVRSSVTSPSERQQAGTIVNSILAEYLQQSARSTPIMRHDSTEMQTEKERKDEMRKEELKRRSEARKRLFLDEKFIRGFFCVHNMLDMYPQFLAIRRQFRNCLLSIFQIHDELRAYNEICSLIDEYLRFVVFNLSDRIKNQKTISVRKYLNCIKALVRRPEGKETDSIFPYKSHSQRSSY